MLINYSLSTIPIEMEFISMDEHKCMDEICDNFMNESEILIEDRSEEERCETLLNL